METRKIETWCGEMFTDVAKRAKQMSIDKNIITEFDFNGINCCVYPYTNLDNLHRDYSNAHLMEWKEVGCICEDEYDSSILEEIATRQKNRDLKLTKENDIRKLKEKDEEELYLEKTKNIEVYISNKTLWNSFVDKNDDPYGKATVEYAIAWGKLMQVELLDGKKLKDVYKSTSFELGFMGISGAMYGFAISMLIKCWIHGEELKELHDKERENIKPISFV